MLSIYPFLFISRLNFSDEFKSFFAKYGKVVEHQIIRDHETNRSRGFGFIIFDSEEVVDELLSKGNMIDMAGTQVSLFKTVVRNQHVDRPFLKTEYASLHSPILSIIYFLRADFSLVSRYLVKRNIFSDLLLNLGGGCFRYRSSQEGLSQ